MLAEQEDLCPIPAISQGSENLRTGQSKTDGSHRTETKLNLTLAVLPEATGLNKQSFRQKTTRAIVPIFSDWLSEQHIFRLIKSIKELTGRLDVSLDKEKNDQTLNCYLNSNEEVNEAYSSGDGLSSVP